MPTSLERPGERRGESSPEVDIEKRTLAAGANKTKEGGDRACQAVNINRGMKILLGTFYGKEK